MGDAHRAVLADDERSRLLLEEPAETADLGGDGGPARIEALIGLAERARRLGDERLAGSLVRSAAYRCWMRRPGNAPTPTIVALVTDAAGSLGDAERAAMLAYAEPIANAAAVAAVLKSVATTEHDSVTVQSLGHAASCIGDFGLADTFFADAAIRLRAEGRLQLLARAVVLQAWARLRRGQWSSAMALSREGARLAAESGAAEWQASGLAAQGMVAALRGEGETAAAAVEAAERIAVPNRMTNAVAISLLARATAAAAEGDFSSAWDYLSRMHHEADPAFHPSQALWSLSHLAYAAIQCGRVERTRELAERLTGGLSPESAGPAVRMNLIYADALLAPERQLERRLRAALEREVGIWPFERSRMQFLLGSRLRRQKRIGESRELLRAARDGFDCLGARPWADRAQDELRAAGVAIQAPGPAAWSTLSAQEVQVARMVAEGLSNRQIGERLYLSHRTVASHLYRLFPKLGITSRAQLTAMTLDRPGLVEQEEASV